MTGHFPDLLDILLFHNLLLTLEFILELLNIVGILGVGQLANGLAFVVIVALFIRFFHELGEPILRHGQVVADVLLHQALVESDRVSVGIL